MQDYLVKNLEEYGLSPKESQIYIITLTLGTAPASSIARHSNLKRVTTYAILQDLVQKWFISSLSKNNVSYFSAVHPSVLHEKLAHKLEKFGDLVPQLLAVSQQYNTQFKVEYFDGFEGMKHLYNKLLHKENIMVRSFLGVHDFNSDFLDYLYKEFVPTRVRNKVSVQTIVSGWQGNEVYQKKLNKKTLNETKMVKHSWFDLRGEIVMYDNDKVLFALFNKEEMSGIHIVSKQLFTTLRSIFDLIWDT